MCTFVCMFQCVCTFVCMFRCVCLSFGPDLACRCVDDVVVRMMELPVPVHAPVCTVGVLAGLLFSCCLAVVVQKNPAIVLR